MPAISIRNVSKQFVLRGGVVQALEDVTCDIDDRQFVSVLGPSGCGKSTLLRIVAGLIPYEQGQVLLQGQPVREPSEHVGVVFQTPNLLPWRTVLGNLRTVLAVRKIRRPGLDADIAKMIEMMGLQGFERSYPHELSGGMQQRAALGQILILWPEILLMDEPFGALDALNRDRLNVELLRMWETQRQTVLFVTHSIQEAVFLSDRIIVFSPRPGKIIADLQIDLPHPRQVKEIRASPEFGRYVIQLSELMGVFG